MKRDVRAWKRRVRVREAKFGGGWLQRMSEREGSRRPLGSWLKCDGGLCCSQRWGMKQLWGHWLACKDAVLRFGHGALGIPRTRLTPQLWDTSEWPEQGSCTHQWQGKPHCQEKEWHPAERPAQSTQCLQNSKMQESVNAATNISPANPSQENSYNPCLELGLNLLKTFYSLINLDL